MKLAKHALFNLVGLGAPLLVALASIPALVHGLGPERFGLLTLVWAVTSYFGLFDLGLGRVLTQQLAILLGQRDGERMGRLCATALSMMLGLGLLGGLAMVALAPWGVDFIKALPDRREAILACLVMGCATPFIVLTAGLRGMLEACHEFEVLNYLRLPLGVWTFAGPWLVLFWQGPDLVAITLALAAGRVIAAPLHAWFAWRAVPELRGQLRWGPEWVRPLLVSGGWMTLSNVVSPLMGYVDRFMIGITVSAAAVAYYVTPQEIVTKLWIIPGALTAVLFPTFAAQAARQDEAARALYKRAVLILLAALLPITAVLAGFAEPLLTLWIGAETAAHSASLLRVFALGILINCLAHVPFTWLQATGRSRAPAVLHCIELPCFLLALWLLAGQWGAMGAAVAWFTRISLDAAVLFWLCKPVRGGGPKAVVD